MYPLCVLDVAVLPSRYAALQQRTTAIEQQCPEQMGPLLLMQPPIVHMPIVQIENAEKKMPVE